MAVATVLFTGGKDSVYALHRAVWDGLEVRVLASIVPHYKYSMLYHQPNYTLLLAQAQALSTPLETIGLADPQREELALKSLLQRVKRYYNIKVVVTGGIRSAFQRNAFKRVAEALGLDLYAPTWGVKDEEYMEDLLRNNINFMIVSITSMGIPHNILGRTITGDDINRLARLSKKYGFNLSFEGGEAETAVVDAPLFKYKLDVRGEVVEVSEFEAYFEIKKVIIHKK